MSNIEWTDRTWNSVIGCTPVSPGCLNCYAATMANRMQNMPQVPEYAPKRIAPNGEVRLGHVAEALKAGTRTIRIAEVRNGRAVFTGDVRTLPDRLGEPLKWRKPAMVFMNSMSDLFHEAVPFEFVDKVFAVMALCPRHTFQVLTKRPERMAEYFAERSWGDVIANVRNEPDEVGRKLQALVDYDAVMSGTREGVAVYHTPRPGRNPLVPDRWPLKNVWIGTSVERQPEADERISHLSKCPAAVRFLSVEPLLGPVNIGLAMCTCPWPIDAMRTRHLMDCPADTRRPEDQRRWALLNWVIVGGESGPGARPCDVAWIRSVVGQCKAAAVPCFVKQLGRNIQIRNDRMSEWPRDGDGLKYFKEDERMPVHQGDPMLVRTEDRKGGDMSEWPEDLRVREMPGGKA